MAKHCLPDVHVGTALCAALARSLHSNLTDKIEVGSKGGQLFKTTNRLFHLNKRRKMGKGVRTSETI